MIKNSTSFNNLNKYMIEQDPIKKKWTYKPDLLK